MREKVSVIMTSYNYAEYIAEAIESVINQTYKNWELIIIDDASTDQSVKIIQEYQQKDERIKLVIHNKNQGLSQSLQDGINLASGKWVAFLESDDKFFENSIQERVDAISTGADIIFTNVQMIGEKEDIEYTNQYFKNLEETFVKLDKSKFIDNFQSIIHRINVIPTFSAVMLRRELLKNRKYNPILKASLDVYLWAQLSDKKVYYINKNLTYWRIHKDSYLLKEKNSWLKNYLFTINLYYQTIKNKNFFIKVLLLLNYMRARLIYFKIGNKSVKTDFFNSKIVIEKHFL